MITVKVIAENGWQNGPDNVPFGEFRTLDTTEDEIKYFLDGGVLEKVQSDTKVINKDDVDAIRKKELEAITEATLAGCMTAFDKMNKQSAQIKIHDRLDDDPSAGFGCFANFISQVEKSTTGKRVSETMKHWKATMASKTAGHANEDDDSQGGYLVPTQFATTLLQTAMDNAIVRPRATFVPMNTNQIQFPAIRNYDHTVAGSGMYGGIQIYRTCEAGDKTPSKPTFGQVQLTLHKLIGLIYVSDELLEDSPISIEPLLNTMFGKTIAWKEDNDFINSGTGAGMPLSVLNAACTVSVTRDAGDQYLNYQDIANMWSRLHPASMANSVWLINNSLLPYLMGMCHVCKDDNGSDISCGATPVYIPSNSAAGSPYGTLLGRPVIVTEHCSAKGSSGDIMLCDFSQYLIGGKAGKTTPTWESSIHVSFLTDETAFRAVLRNDGKPWWETYLSPKHGSATLSPFIVLGNKS